jgi:glucose-6-phosphate 1-dehydrogenase
MDRPVSMHPDDIRDEKTKVIRAMRTIEAQDVVVAQYEAAGGKPGYTDDEGVPDDSTTATYCAVRLWCDNERWSGTPMVIKAGAHSDVVRAACLVQSVLRNMGWVQSLCNSPELSIIAISAPPSPC